MKMIKTPEIWGGHNLESAQSLILSCDKGGLKV